MKFHIENMVFEIPATTILTGPLAAAKPIFAQKFAVEWINNGGKVAYFATDSPVEGVISNMKALGLKEDLLRHITFFDHDPKLSYFKKISKGFAGNFSNAEQLKESFSIIKDAVVIIPSFTLLLIGVKNKEKLAEVIIEHLIERKKTSFIGINSAMFENISEMLSQNADNVLEFIKRKDGIYIKIVKFRGEFAFQEMPFNFPSHLFHKTKKEVIERTSNLIKEKKRASH